MKKTIALVLTLILALALTACGGAKKESSAEDLPVASEQNDTNESIDPVVPEADTEAKDDGEAENDEPATSSKPEDAVSKPAASSKPAVSSKPAAAASTPATANPSKPAATVTPTPSEPEPTVPAVSSKVESSSPDTNFYLNTTDTSYVADKIIVRARHVYWEGDTLVAQCFVINGFPHNVWDINVEGLRISNKQGVIAEGSFGYLNGVNLPTLTNCIWTFRFTKDCVLSQGADLSWLSIDFNITSAK